jgi:hypothetical protein
MTIKELMNLLDSFEDKTIQVFSYDCEYGNYAIAEISEVTLVKELDYYKHERYVRVDRAFRPIGIPEKAIVID